MSKSKPKAEPAPPEDARPRREPGKGRGAWHVAADFDAPLPDDVRVAFEGEKPCPGDEDCD